MIDIDHQINAVRRTVGTTTLDAGEARVITVSQTYDTDVKDLWDACTTAERISRWAMPITGDLEVGGRYQLEGNAGGQVLSCEPPTTFSATWEYGTEASWITLRLTEEGPERTRFQLEHVAHVTDELWAQFGPGAVGVGWDSLLLGLALHHTGAPGMDRAEAATWSVSDEGRRFMTGSSDCWYEAAVAGGDDPQAARAAADRTTEAYTAVPEDA